MRPIIIGTAGHIDHGKTALIRALTGRETDRLEEERRRGITIDLGFTWMDLENGMRAGVIDVPAVSYTHLDVYKRQTDGRTVIVPREDRWEATQA